MPSNFMNVFGLGSHSRSIKLKDSQQAAEFFVDTKNLYGKSDQEPKSAYQLRIDTCHGILEKIEVFLIKNSKGNDIFESADNYKLLSTKVFETTSDNQLIEDSDGKPDIQTYTEKFEN